ATNGRPPPRPSAGARPLRLGDIDTADLSRIPIGIPEFARVMGGGLVRGSLTLVGGDPGVGKSTLLAQVAIPSPKNQPARCCTSRAKNRSHRLACARGAWALTPMTCCS